MIGLPHETFLVALSFALACSAIFIKTLRLRSRVASDLAGMPALLVMMLGFVLALAHLFNAPLTDAAGNLPMALPTAVALVVLGLAIAIPVALRDRAEQRKRDRDRAHIDGAFEHAALGIALVAPDGRWLRVNRALCGMVGYTEQELLATNFQTITHPDDMGADLEFVRQMLAGEIQRYEMEKRYFHRLGHVIWVLLSVSLVRDADGAPKYFISQLQNITKRKRAEAALAESRALLAAAESIAHVGSWAMDMETGQLVWSDNMFRMVGREPTGAPVSREWFMSHVHPDDRATVHAAFQSLVQTGDAPPVECRIVRPDGTERTIQARGRVQRAPGGDRVTHVLGSAQDVTERKELEEQLRQSQRLDAVGQLAGGVAHDFNNLLMVITSYAALLLEDLDQSDPRRNDVSEVAKAADRAATLTQQLLAFGRRQLLQPRVLDVNHTVTELEKMLRRVLTEDIELVTVLDPALRCVRADPGQLEQVVMNLVVNARDAMPGGGTLTIETGNVEILGASTRHNRGAVPPGAYVRLTVTDTGHGMDEATQERIFEPFFTTKPPGKGTGLGLSTVYGIVKQSGGYVSCESARGQGTTLKIFLPVTSASADRRGSAAAPAPIRRGAERVLVVEDDAAVRSVAGRILTSHGYVVLQAPTGAEALRILDETGYVDLVVTDVVMPEMSGSELARQLHERHPAVPVLFMSGYAGEAALRESLPQPGAAFIEKPFAPDAFVARVRALLDQPVLDNLSTRLA